MQAAPNDSHQKQLGERNFNQIMNKNAHKTPTKPNTAQEAPIVSICGSPTAENRTPPMLLITYKRNRRKLPLLFISPWNTCRDSSDALKAFSTKNPM